MHERTPLLVWVLLIGVVVLGTATTTAGLPAVSPSEDESTSGNLAVSGVEYSAVTDNPSVADVAGAAETGVDSRPSDTSSRVDRFRGADTDDSRTDTGQTQPSYNCSRGEEQKNVTLPNVERQAYFQTTVGLELFNSTVTSRVPNNGSETFGIFVGRTEADRFCTSLVDQASATRLSSGRSIRIRIQLKNPRLTDVEIRGNGMNIRSEWAEADYINQVVSFGHAMQMMPEMTKSVTFSTGSRTRSPRPVRRSRPTVAMGTSRV